MLDLIVKNANIVMSDNVHHASVGVKNGKIHSLLPPDTNCAAARTIDASGLYLFPGLIDAHVHFNDPGFLWREDFSHATRAANVGGVTTVIDMPLQNAPALTNADIFKQKMAHLKGKAYSDYAFWGGMIHDNLDRIEELNLCGAVAFKSFIAPVSSDYTSLDYGRIRKGLSIIKKFGGLAGFHCEDYGIISYNADDYERRGLTSRQDYLNARPVVAELIAVKSIIELSRESDTRVHICHVSHPQVAEAIKQAKREGVHITAETCPHYLIFSESDFLEKGMSFKCAPPLRADEDRQQLWNYLEDGTLDIIASDHSPCAVYEKAEDYGALKPWGGISGVQTSLQIMFNELVIKRRWSPTFIARAMSVNAATIFGISANKGKITQGSDADFVLVDPEKTWRITPESLYYLNKQSAFVGMKGRGIAVMTVLRGNIVSQNGSIIDEEPKGEWIRPNGSNGH